MADKLPSLQYEDLLPTRDYLREVALVLGSLQRAFLPKHPRDWQHGLEINIRGLITQPFTVGGDEIRASLDLVRHKVRLGDSFWSLKEYAAPEIFNNIRSWLESRGENATLEQPKFEKHIQHYDSHQASLYAEALWWIDIQFRALKANIAEGMTSPILLYPHHFDLSLVWFPHDDERQLAIGFSTGDDTIAEPYLYLTAYPEPGGFTTLHLPDGAHWQTAGFSGAILPYSVLASSDEPEQLFRDYGETTIKTARPLLG